jgi:DNA-directed RNA polymerase subunit RPC12/RpoP
MNCWHCKAELIWGGDHDLEKAEGVYSDEYKIVTNLSCPQCGSLVLVYFPRETADIKP